MRISRTLPNLLPNDWVWSPGFPGLYFYPFSGTEFIIHSPYNVSCDEYLFSTDYKSGSENIAVNRKNKVTATRVYVITGGMGDTCGNA